MSSDFPVEENPSRSRDNKATRIVFTAWPPEGTDDESHEFEAHSSFIKFISWGCEVSPTTHRKHYQGYAVMTKKMKYTTIKNVLKSVFGGKSPYVAAMRGTLEECEAYISKDGCIHHWGARPRELRAERAAGGRRAVDEFAARLARGDPLVQVALEEPGVFLRYSRGAQLLASYVARPLRLQKTRTTTLLYGPTGLGKTWDVIPDAATTHDIFRVAATGSGWLDGYLGQDTVVFDDFRGAADGFSVSVLLQLLDPSFTATGNVKGGTVYWNPSWIYITSNEHPSKWYDWDKRWHSYDALIRRLSEVCLLYSLLSRLGSHLPRCSQRYSRPSHRRIPLQ